MLQRPRETLGGKADPSPSAPGYGGYGYDSSHGYRAGYEPSAPPEPPHQQHQQQQQQHHPDNNGGFFLGDRYPPTHFDPHHRGARARAEEAGGGETLGQRMLGVAAGAVRGLWRTSHTVLRLELRRGISYQGPLVQRSGPGRRQQRRRSSSATTIADQAGATVSVGGRFYGGQTKGFSDQEWAAAPPPHLPPPHEDGGGRRWQGGGARLKLMQVWDFPDLKVHNRLGKPQGQSQHQEVVGTEPAQGGGDAHEGKKASTLEEDKEDAAFLRSSSESPRRDLAPWRVNLGLGANVDTDRGVLEPRFRVRGHHVAVHLLPEPVLEIRGKWPLFNTQLALDARYRVPLLGLPNLWSGDSGARLMVNLFNPLGTGVHLTPGGLEFDEHLVRLGEYTTIRVAAALDFPRQFPLPEGEQPIKVRINRLGLKTRIQ